MFCHSGSISLSMNHDAIDTIDCDESSQYMVCKASISGILVGFLFVVATITIIILMFVTFENK